MTVDIPGRGLDKPIVILIGTVPISTFVFTGKIESTSSGLAPVLAKYLGQQIFGPKYNNFGPKKKIYIFFYKKNNLLFSVGLTGSGVGSSAGQRYMGGCMLGQKCISLKSFFLTGNWWTLVQGLWSRYHFFRVRYVFI